MLNFPQALRVSMEEQRQRQEEEARRAAAVSAVEAGIVTPTGDGGAFAERGRGSVSCVQLLKLVGSRPHEEQQCCGGLAVGGNHLLIMLAVTTLW